MPILHPDVIEKKYDKNIHIKFILKEKIYILKNILQFVYNDNNVT